MLYWRARVSAYITRQQDQISRKHRQLSQVYSDPYLPRWRNSLADTTLPPLPSKGKRKLQFGYISVQLLLLIFFSHLPRFGKHVANLIHDLSSIAPFGVERWKNQPTRLAFILTGIFNFGLLVFMFLTHALPSNSFLFFILICMIPRPPSSCVFILLLLLFFFFSSRRFAKRLLLGVRICRFVTHIVVNKSICQRSFDLWLVLRAWPHTPQAFFWKYHAMSASFCRRARKQGQNTPPGTPYPTLFEKCVGLFTSSTVVNNEELRDGADS